MTQTTTGRHKDGRTAKNLTLLITAVLIECAAFIYPASIKKEAFLSSAHPNVTARTQAEPNSNSTNPALLVKSVPSAPPKKPKPYMGNLADPSLMANPDYATAYAIFRKPILDLRYGRLFAKLQISNDDRERLKNLILQRDADVRDAAQVARAAGVLDIKKPDSIKQYREIVQTARQQDMAAIEGVIGEKGMADLRQYENTLPARDFLVPLIDRMASLNAPVTDQQLDALAEAVGNARASDLLKGGRSGPSNQYSPAVVDAASKILSADQLAALNDIAEENRARLALAVQVAAATKRGSK